MIDACFACYREVMQVRFATWLALLLFGTACSPIKAGREIGDAQNALNAARDAGAARFAIYEFTAATEYLHKAREENNYSDYDAACTYAAHARELAQQARSVAQRQNPGGYAPASEASDPMMMEPEKPAPGPPESATSAAIDDLPQDEVMQKKGKGRGR